jgi:hypothetical protein
LSKITKINAEDYSAILTNYPRFTGIVEDSQGDRCSYLNGKRHSEDGPATDWVNGYVEWWINDKRFYSKEEWRTAVLNIKMKRIVSTT